MSKYTPIASKLFTGWFEIPGFSGYCANAKGQILNKKTKNSTSGGRAGRYLKVSAYKDGNSKPSLYYVHDLICRAFHGIPQLNQVVLHKDNNRFNNVPSNLRWGSQSENILQVYQDGLKYSKKYSVTKEHYPVWFNWDDNISFYDPSLEEYEYVSINSSNIQCIGYDLRKKELEVEFKSNSIYRFFNVSKKRFLNLVHSESVGRYFVRNIKNHYDYKKIN